MNRQFSKTPPLFRSEPKQDLKSLKTSDVTQNVNLTSTNADLKSLIGHLDLSKTRHQIVSTKSVYTT